MKPMSYTADVQTLHSGTITFENVPGNIYRAVIDLLGGHGVIETREPSRPETVDVQPVASRSPPNAAVTESVLIMFISLSFLLH